jgi:hypothetical protein
MAKSSGKLGRNSRIRWEQRTFVATICLLSFSAAFPELDDGAKNFGDIYFEKLKKRLTIAKSTGKLGWDNRIGWEQRTFVSTIFNSAEIFMAKLQK